MRRWNVLKKKEILPILFSLLVCQMNGLFLLSIPIAVYGMGNLVIMKKT